MKYVISIVVSLLVGLGFGYLVFHNGATTQPVGGVYEPIASHYGNGLYVGSSDQLSVSDVGLVTTSGGITDTGTLTQSGAATLSGALTASNAKNRGTLTLVAGSATTTITAGAKCVATDITATTTGPIMATTSSTTLTVQGAGTDQVNYICF